MRGWQDGGGGGRRAARRGGEAAGRPYFGGTGVHDAAAVLPRRGARPRAGPGITRGATLNSRYSPNTNTAASALNVVVIYSYQKRSTVQAAALSKRKEHDRGTVA
jgi:hypothetical protein